jgi:hypothetical protein
MQHDFVLIKAVVCSEGIDATLTTRGVARSFGQTVADGGFMCREMCAMVRPSARRPRFRASAGSIWRRIFRRTPVRRFDHLQPVRFMSSGCWSSITCDRSGAFACIMMNNSRCRVRPGKKASSPSVILQQTIRRRPVAQ